MPDHDGLNRKLSALRSELAALRQQSEEAQRAAILQRQEARAICQETEQMIARARALVRASVRGRNERASDEHPEGSGS
jgi:hypothetical protein